MEYIITKYEKEIIQTLKEYIRDPYDYNEDYFKDEIRRLYQVNGKQICINLEDLFSTEKLFRIAIWDASTERNWQLLELWDCVYMEYVPESWQPLVKEIRNKIVKPQWRKQLKGLFRVKECLENGLKD